MLITKYNIELEKGSRKFRCPQCNKKEFVRYIDNSTGQYLPEEYGRCDNENKCGYFLKPYNHIKDNGSRTGRCPTIKVRKVEVHEAKPINFNKEAFVETLDEDGYKDNTFIKNLTTSIPHPFPEDRVMNIISLYLIGTVRDGYMKGAATFPYIDEKLNISTVQARLFDADNHGKKTDFLHSIIERNLSKQGSQPPKWLVDYLAQDGRVHCLFGEHLLPTYTKHTVVLAGLPRNKKPPQN